MNSNSVKMTANKKFIARDVHIEVYVDETGRASYLPQGEKKKYCDNCDKMTLQFWGMTDEDDREIWECRTCCGIHPPADSKEENKKPCDKCDKMTLQCCGMTDENDREIWECRTCCGIHPPVDSKEEAFITPETIVSGIVCRPCGRTVPPHTVARHLDVNDPIHRCPHDDWSVERLQLKRLYYCLEEQEDLKACWRGRGRKTKAVMTRLAELEEEEKKLREWIRVNVVA